MGWWHTFFSFKQFEARVVCNTMVDGRGQSFANSLTLKKFRKNFKFFIDIPRFFKTQEIIIWSYGRRSLFFLNCFLRYHHITKYSNIWQFSYMYNFCPSDLINFEKIEKGHILVLVKFQRKFTHLKIKMCKYFLTFGS